MSGDYSRIRFDPRKHFTNVLMQQGRVQLDSDWNELAAVFDRRFRAQLADTLGRFVVPRRTPDAFLVRRSGAGLSIGPGRIYVDGLMAENHGAGAQVFDPVLHEPRGADPIDYRTGQPYFPPARVPELPDPPDGAPTPMLVYLDVWQRERTHVEDPELVEPAIGIDTATRTQIAWRVRVLTDDALRDPPTLAQLDPPSGAPPAFWAAATRPPAGRLTTATDDVGDPESDPCIIPPSGGFRGLENQLYRLEIHTPGPAGTATFKWSRDDASVASSVTALTRFADPAASDTLTVASVGRDAVLRFAAGDWVELLDDLQEPDAVAGVMLLVRRVDDDARLIELDPATKIPAEFAGTSEQLAERRTRVRRWDQRGSVDVDGVAVDLRAPASGGVLPIPAKGVKVRLEHGITVEFSVADDADKAPFRAGDHWLFAARTATADIEQLSAAPPHGHHHHFAPLAWVRGAQVVDLRRKWPDVDAAGQGDCDVHVDAAGHNAGDFTIQDAINRLRDAGGGTICLGRGVFFVTADALRIDGLPGPTDPEGRPRRGVTLRGRGPQTVLIRQFEASAPPNPDDDDAPPEDFEALPPFDSDDIPALDLALAPRALLRIEGAADVALSDLVLVSSAGANLRVGGVVARDVTDLRIERCFFLHAGTNDSPTLSPALALGGAVTRARIADNTFVASVGLGLDIDRRLLLADLDLRRNTFSCRRRGVALDDPSIVHLRRTAIAGNDLACGSRGIDVNGRVHDGGLVDIADNTVDAGDAVVVGATRVTVRGNTLIGPRGRLAGESRPTEPDTLLSSFRTGVGVPRGEQGSHCRVEGNTIRGFDFGVSCNNRVGDLVVRGNLIEDCDNRGVSVSPGVDQFGTNATVEGNTIRRIGLAQRASTDILGVNLEFCDRAIVRDNALEQVGDLPLEYPGGGVVSGIHMIISRRVHVAGNQLVDVGPTRPLTRPPANCSAILVSDPLETIEVTGNSVGHTDAFRTAIACRALLIGQSKDSLFNAHFFSTAVMRSSALRRTISIRGNRLAGIFSSLGDRDAPVRIHLDAFDLVFAENHVQVFEPLGLKAGPGPYLFVARVNEDPKTRLPPTFAKILHNTFESMPEDVSRTIDVTAVAGSVTGNILHNGAFAESTRNLNFAANSALVTPDLEIL